MGKIKKIEVGMVFSVPYIPDRSLVVTKIIDNDVFEAAHCVVSPFKIIGPPGSNGLEDVELRITRIKPRLVRQKLDDYMKSARINLPQMRF